MNEMKNFWRLLLLTCALTGWRLPASAQGVILTAGESLTIGFDGVDSCHPADASPFTYVFLGFRSDEFGPDESLRLEMFEDSLNDVPFASQTYNPVTALSGINLYGPGAWFDYQGLIRVSMLRGSVEVAGAQFIVYPNTSMYCEAVVLVPEPSTWIFAGLSAGAAILCALWRGKAWHAAGST